MSYLNQYRHVRLRVGGDDLKRLGYAPGPGFGRVLRTLLNERIDGIIGEAEEAARLRAIAEQVFSDGSDDSGRGMD